MAGMVGILRHQLKQAERQLQACRRLATAIADELNMEPEEGTNGEAEPERERAA